MLSFEKLEFYNPSKGIIKFGSLAEEVFSYMKQEPESFYEIVAGCDSSSDMYPVFPVAIVVLRKGFGGRFFLTKIKYQRMEKKKFFTFQQRILEEVYLSCEVALRFREALKERISRCSKVSLRYRFEYIHADVGKNGPTKDMIKEVAGLIRSNGFTPKIKPQSFAASIVADRFS